MPTQADTFRPKWWLKSYHSHQDPGLLSSVLTIPGLELQFYIGCVRPLSFQSTTGLLMPLKSVWLWIVVSIDFPQDSTVGRPDPSAQVCGRRGRGDKYKKYLSPKLCTGFLLFQLDGVDQLVRVLIYRPSFIVFKMWPRSMLLALMTIMTLSISILNICGEFVIQIVLEKVSLHSTTEHGWAPAGRFWHHRFPLLFTEHPLGACPKWNSAVTGLKVLWGQSL